MLNQLPLGLVDGHSKCKPDRELLALHVKANGLLSEFELDPGDEGLLPMVVSAKQMHLQDVPLAASEDGPGAIAYTRNIEDFELLESHQKVFSKVIIFKF